MAVVMCAACASRVAPPMPLPAEVIEYVIPWSFAFPSDVVVDDAGRVWFTDRLGSGVGRLDPETGVIERFVAPTKSAPYGFVNGPDGALWYAANRAGRLGRVDPASGAITEVVLEGVAGRDGPTLLAVQGNRIWFTMRGVAQYGSHEPATGVTRMYAVPEGMNPYGIAAGLDDRVWISGYDQGLLLEVDAATDTVRLHDLHQLAQETAGVWGVSVPDSVRRRSRMRRVRLRRMTVDGGGRVWLSDFGGGRVLAFDPAARSVEEFGSLNVRPEPYGILADADGRIWYNEKRYDIVVALDPASGRRTTYRLPTRGAAVRHIAIDRKRGRVWLPLSDRGRIGMIPLRADALPGPQARHQLR